MDGATKCLEPKGVKGESMSLNAGGPRLYAIYAIYDHARMTAVRLARMITAVSLNRGRRVVLTRSHYSSRLDSSPLADTTGR